MYSLVKVATINECGILRLAEPTLASWLKNLHRVEKGHIELMLGTQIDGKLVMKCTPPVQYRRRTPEPDRERRTWTEKFSL